MQRTFHIDYSSQPRYPSTREESRPAARGEEADDALRPARGVVHGVLAGAAFWFLLILVYWLA